MTFTHNPLTSDKTRDIIWDFIIDNYETGIWFTSRQVADGTGIDINSVGDYLSEFYNDGKGRLNRRGKTKDTEYALKS